MTTKEYLNQAYRVKELIDSNDRQLQELRDRTTKITIGFNEPVQGGKPGNIGDIAVEIVELKAKIKEDSAALARLLTEIRGVINQVHNADEKLLLNLRYLEFKKWEDIAPIMGYTIRQTTRIHGRALKKVENVLKCP